MNICENINYPPPKKSTFHLPSDLINAIMTAHDSFCAQDVPVVGFMSGGMVIGTMSEGIIISDEVVESANEFIVS